MLQKELRRRVEKTKKNAVTAFIHACFMFVSEIIVIYSADIPHILYFTRFQKSDQKLQAIFQCWPELTDSLLSIDFHIMFLYT